MRSLTYSLALPLAPLFLVACGGGDLVLPGEPAPPEEPGPPADLQMIGGDEQEAAAGAELPEPVRVRLVDDEGVGVPGVVSWVVGLGGGSVNPVNAETDAEGFAQARWTLGPEPGVNTVSAVVSGLDVITFTASATGDEPGGEPLAPDHLVFEIEPAGAMRGERISPPVIVAVVDRNGAIVPDFKVKIRIELAAGEGKLDGKRDKDTKDGIAVFDDLRIDHEGEGYVLRAFAPEVSFLGSVETAPFTVREKD